MFVVIKTDEKVWLRKRKRFLKLILILRLFPFRNAKISSVLLKKPAINNFVDMHGLKCASVNEN